ncbi:hypothetical protein [Microbispora sp. ATCC PTA-5024]|uniref:hypothetical protein n=1 Tax=Microbispora sp. ATCC PTA-5024 TaxID=316330 RepID=UPI000413BFA9|nr:hypothetical protein [Microbispora sp. ATCC PTA-5024]
MDEIVQSSAGITRRLPGAVATTPAWGEADTTPGDTALDDPHPRAANSTRRQYDRGWAGARS